MIKKLPKSLKILTMLFPLTMASLYSFAQRSGAELKGTIKNEAGVAIENVQVIIQSVQSGALWNFRTNAKGAFQSTALPLSDSYNLTLTALGYASTSLDIRRLSPNHENLIQVILKKGPSVSQPKENIYGVILDEESNKPLPGVTIASSSGDGGNISNREGKYTIKLKLGDVVHFSYIGYKSQHLIVKNNMIQAGRLPDIKMEVSLNHLKDIEVFSNGYQKVSKERSTATVTVVDMKAFRSRSGQPDILARMEGLVPGLSFNKSYQQGNSHWGTPGTDFNRQYPDGGILSPSDKANYSGDASYDQRLVTLRGKPVFSQRHQAFLFLC